MENVKYVYSTSIKYKVQVPRLRGVCDNTTISVDYLSVNIIQHSQWYFQCRFVKNNLKSETNMEYTKLRKARDNNRKSGS